MIKPELIYLKLKAVLWELWQKKREILNQYLSFVVARRGIEPLFKE